ncbi:hypothetical protein WT41_23030 [Burkholderia territorii]|nr:hypothetical protein WT39_22670 [Burkholderia territorii]KWA25713.1 hypothetical protein WT38_07300 [Burkholderia territorii]KWA38550.1 hypothetical protein WT41_23030 [Burkholderia territorii]
MRRAVAPHADGKRKRSTLHEPRYRRAVPDDAADASRCAARRERLLRYVIDALAANGFATLFVVCSTDPAAHSCDFCRRLRPTSTGKLDHAGDEICTRRDGQT